MTKLDVQWIEASLDEISARQFHQLMKLRLDVFVVEQNCVYPDLDGQDALDNTQHIFASDAAGNVIAAARVLGSSDAQPVRIGRVVVEQQYRGTGLSKQLMDRVMAYCRNRYAGEVLELSAQVGADGLYAGFGFKVVSDDYLEDGIPHRDMRFTG